MPDAVPLVVEGTRQSRVALPLLNQHQATFECTFGRGCDGHCCRNGRPGLYPDEIVRIQSQLERVLPRLRPEARRHLLRASFLTRRVRDGVPLAAVVDGWCIFFNEGCVLHAMGAEEGDKYRYKPIQCALFPLLRDDEGRWYVRQHGYRNEKWDLFCLSPSNSCTPAVESLREEIELAARIEEENCAEETTGPDAA